jgi:hypothetical protein
MRGAARKGRMKDLLLIGAVFAAWILLQAVILPKLGFST